MFSERLEKLIEAALQDGQLTEQEKASIIKRAEAEGEDINEVDIYIQSLQQKRQQELIQQAQQAETEKMIAQKKELEAKRAAAAEEEKERARLLRKCPACGTPIPAATNVCPNCGYIVESSEITKKISKLIREIKQYDYADSEYNELIADLRIKYGPSPEVQAFLQNEKKGVLDRAKSEMDEKIKTIYEPINRECSYEAQTILDQIKDDYELIKTKYSEFIDEPFINRYNQKIEELQGKIEALNASDKKFWRNSGLILVLLFVITYILTRLEKLGYL